MKKFILIFCLVIFSCASEDDLENFKDLELDQQVMKLINNYRSENGKNELKPHDYLKSLCQDHSNYMNSQGELSHDKWFGRKTAIKKKLGTYFAVENVGYNNDSNAEAIFYQWRSSRSHNVNLLKDYTHFYVASNESDGITYYTYIAVKIK